MKKNIFTKMLLILMIAALLLTTAGCSKEDESAQQITQLEQENAALQQQIDALTAELDAMKQKAILASWELDADIWNSNDGATITFTAVPVTYVPAQSVALSVRINGMEAESALCIWDENAYVTSVELHAADGYSYYCILTSADGTQEEVALNTPENAQDDSLVNLATSLSAYANIIVENWKHASGKLTVDSGYIQVLMPRLRSGSDKLTMSQAALVLSLNGEEVERQSITIPAGEAEGSYEMTLGTTSFSMPAMKDEHQLDLWLEVALSDGSTITAPGGSWYFSDGELLLIVG